MGQLIFVVEDEPIILLVVEDTLKDGGFDVVTSLSGEDAFPMLERAATDYRLILTDINLTRGGLTGWDVARRAREVAAGIPIIYMTGLDERDWASKGVKDSILLVKPFAPAQLIAAIDTLLGRLPRA